MNEIKAPERTKLIFSKSVFLAGSIEMGNCEDWQSKISKQLKFKKADVFNPRRDDWDSSWVQDINNPQFFEQVTWELDMLDECDIIFMYFDPTTKSPISLLELGLYAALCENHFISSKQMIVCCPNGFWRKGNVDIVCQRYGIPVFNNLETAIIKLKSLI
jgi:hypothetical protein